MVSASSQSGDYFVPYVHADRSAGYVFLRQFSHSLCGLRISVRPDAPNDRGLRGVVSN